MAAAAIDPRLYVQATSAAQAVMSVTTAGLRVDGKWGSYTQKAYEALSSTERAKVDQMISVIAPGQTAKACREFRAREKASGVPPGTAAVTATFGVVALATFNEAKRRGYVSPGLVVAQAAHESNGGASALSSKYNNYGGLKVGISPNRANGQIRFNTKEGSGATERTENAAFLTFASPGDWIVTELDYLERMTKGKIKQAKTAEEYNNLLRGFGYYTANGAVYLAGLKRHDTFVA